jgi:hypothetical protein
MTQHGFGRAASTGGGGGGGGNARKRLYLLVPCCTNGLILRISPNKLCPGGSVSGFWLRDILVTRDSEVPQ